MRFLFSIAVLLFATAANAVASPPQIEDFDVASPSLTTFWNNATSIRSQVLLPDSYWSQPERRYPVLFVVPAFYEAYRFNSISRDRFQSPMRALKSEFIIVRLNGMVRMFKQPMHQEFADSVNSGPWGTALTSEYIPALDRAYRTIPEARARFLFGHSSGGWSVLWLQVNYPGLFGGAWAISPDPVDFHDFLDVDITSKSVNLYHDGRGNPYTMYRVGGHDVESSQQFVGSFYEQFRSFDDVFSPQTATHVPAAMFDLKTGDVNAPVAAYWESHYDLTTILRTRWDEVGPELDGKLHVFVGTADTFHLDGPVRRMQAAIAALGGMAEFGYYDGADHWQIYNFHNGIVQYSMREMAASLAAATPAPAAR